MPKSFEGEGGSKEKGRVEAEIKKALPEYKDVPTFLTEFVRTFVFSQKGRAEIALAVNNPEGLVIHVFGPITDDEEKAVYNEVAQALETRGYVLGEHITAEFGWSGEPRSSEDYQQNNAYYVKRKVEA